MKKTIAIILLILTFFITYFIQSNFFNWFTIAGVQPNLFVMYILFIGLFAGKKIGAIFGVIFGLYLDIVIGRQIGISGIMLGLIGLIGEHLDKSFSKESRLTIMLMVAGSTVIYEVGCYVSNVVTLDMNVEIISFIKILLIEVLYNIILVIILYSLIQKIGHALEEIFKTKNILTRYF